MAWAIGIALVLPWLVLWFRPAKPEVVPAPTPAEAPTAAFNSQLTHTRPGPWGELEYTRILVEPPEDFILDLPPAPLHVSWIFKDHSADALVRLWQAAELTEAQLTALSDRTTWQIESDRVVVRVHRDIVLALSTVSRTHIYNVLARFPENAVQNEPFRFRADAASEWFADSELEASTLEKVKRLLYRRGTSILFSDYELVVPMIESPEERIKLLKTLARKSTLLVRLRVRRDSDVEALAQYWGRGTRAKDVKPLLQSIARRPEGYTIDIAHLLPRFARALLYSYPVPQSAMTDEFHDCHWTSFNFFNDPPDERFADIALVKQTLETEYYPTSQEPWLGDIVMLMKPNGVAVHSCVFVADNIVFTKNGSNPTMPWILMTLDDLIAFYPSDSHLEIRRYRPRER